MKQDGTIDLSDIKLYYFGHEHGIVPAKIRPADFDAYPPLRGELATWIVDGSHHQIIYTDDGWRIVHDDRVYDIRLDQIERDACMQAGKPKAK